ncbi:hypothetical protein SAZ11_02760 [Streptomyces sp. FXJ1.4098]|nr:hypothetical protein [Streptomyces sp. FXJ1.4098]
MWRPVAAPDAFGEVFAAQRPVEVPAPAGTRLLARKWEPARATDGRRPTAVAVLGAGPAARRLAEALPDATSVASAADLDDRFDALVDLGGLALDAWLPAVQRMAGREALLLGVGAGDARAGLYRMLRHEYGRVRSRYLEADPADPSCPAWSPGSWPTGARTPRSATWTGCGTGPASPSCRSAPALRSASRPTRRC